MDNWVLEVNDDVRCEIWVDDMRYDIWVRDMSCVIWIDDTRCEIWVDDMRLDLWVDDMRCEIWVDDMRCDIWVDDTRCEIWVVGESIYLASTLATHQGNKSHQHRYEAGFKHTTYRFVVLWSNHYAIGVPWYVL